ncbi:MAG TPA: hypothetical protein PK794_09300, partial [Armatimonadota bacterium]|nr:hypothetical protein [Armatimonadota bacterium]
VFGHNVNIACRLCDLGAPGQTYMSTPVYDNARLIIGDRADLRWLAWEELPIRGIAAPMTVVGVAQHPYYEILPPRGINTAKRTGGLKVPLAMAAAGLAVAVLIGGAVGVMMKRGPSASPVTVATPMAARSGEEPLPPVVATVADPLEEEPADPDAPAPSPDGDTSPPDGEAAPPDAEAPGTETDPHAAATATAVTLTPTPDPSPPPATAEPKTPAMDPDIKAYFPHLLKPGAPITLGDGAGANVPGTLTIIRAKGALLVAVGVEEPTTAESRLALVVDGNRDNRLQSERESPFLDLMLSAAGPGAETPPALLALKDGSPGDPLTVHGAAGRVTTQGRRTVWMFRVPFSALGVTSGMRVNFRVDYAADTEAAVLRHPPGADGRGLRELAIP